MAPFSLTTNTAITSRVNACDIPEVESVQSRGCSVTTDSLTGVWFKRRPWRSEWPHGDHEGLDSTVGSDASRLDLHVCMQQQRQSTSPYPLHGCCGAQTHTPSQLLRSRGGRWKAVSVSRFGLAVSGGTSFRIRFGSPFSSKVVVCGHMSCDFVLHNYETLKWLSSLPTLMHKSVWCWQCSDRYIIYPPTPTSIPPSPLLPVPNKPYGFWAPCLLTSGKCAFVFHRLVFEKEGRNFVVVLRPVCE